MTAIDKLSFVPQAEARARSLQHIGRIGVITPFFIIAPSFTQRLSGIAQILSPKNYELVIYTVDSVNHLQGYLSSLPLTGNLDGLIILSLPVGDAEVRLRRGENAFTRLCNEARWSPVFIDKDKRLQRLDAHPDFDGIQVGLIKPVPPEQRRSAIRR